MSVLAQVAAGEVVVAGLDFPLSGPPTSVDPVQARLQAEFPDEDFGWMGSVTSKLYRALFDQGWPEIECSAGPIGKVRGVLLQYHLDGSGWVMQWHGAQVRLPADLLGRPPTSMCSPAEVRAWAPVNLHHLTDSQVKVLLAVAGPNTVSAQLAGLRADAAGLTDEQIAEATGLAVSTVQHLRGDLVHKCLVIDKQGPHALRESSAGARVQVWVITHTGELALRPPAPSTELLATWLERNAIAPPG